jgi:hypothetical protein
MFLVNEAVKQFIKKLKHDKITEIEYIKKLNKQQKKEIGAIGNAKLDL